MRQIQKELNYCKDVCINHVYMEANTCVDGLAKLALSQNIGLKVFESYPTKIYSLYIADMEGKSSKRKVYI